MQDNTPRSSSYLWIYAVVAAVAVTAIFCASHLTTLGGTTAGVGWGMMAAASLSLVAICVSLPISLSLRAARIADAERQQELVSKLYDRLQQISLLLNLVTENQLISDRTKAVVFREKDRDTIRRAVVDEMARQDWEAALALVNDMDRVFGYKIEADRFRIDIAEKRKDVVQTKISEQLTVVDRFINAEAWGQALQEAQRIMTLFPNDEKVTHLPSDIEARRLGRKKKLLDSWHEAVKNHDVDGSIEILKHLDLYLTPSEAEGMQEAARGVFKEKIALLRAQFAMAVQDHRWAEALTLGDTIISEFPNSRMAQEVRDTMVMLRQRASDGNAAAV